MGETGAFVAWAARLGWGVPTPPDPAAPRAGRSDRSAAARDRYDERLGRRLADANLASAIYGQILVLSVLAALGHDDDASAGRILATVLASQLVFWLAHAYAQTVGEAFTTPAARTPAARTPAARSTAARPDASAQPEHPTVEDRGPRPTSGLGRNLIHEWPTAQAALPTTALMIIAIAGGIEPNTGIDVALGLGVASLFLWGFAAGGRTRTTLAGKLTAGIISGALGLLIVFLKLLIH